MEMSQVMSLNTFPKFSSVGVISGYKLKLPVKLYHFQDNLLQINFFLIGSLNDLKKSNFSSIPHQFRSFAKVVNRNESPFFFF